MICNVQIRGVRADLTEPTEPTSRILIGPSYQMQPSDWPVCLKDGVSSHFCRGANTPNYDIQRGNCPLEMGSGPILMVETDFQSYILDQETEIIDIRGSMRPFYKDFDCLHK